MNFERTDSTSQGTLWSVQPTWVKLVSWGILLPAWLLFLCTILFPEQVPEQYSLVAMWIMLPIAAIQILFVARAAWRRDI